MYACMRIKHVLRANGHSMDGTAVWWPDSVMGLHPSCTQALFLSSLRMGHADLLYDVRRNPWGVQMLRGGGRWRWHLKGVRPTVTLGPQALWRET